jgi:hypothetical protein
MRSFVADTAKEDKKGSRPAPLFACLVKLCLKLLRLAVPRCVVLLCPVMGVPAVSLVMPRVMRLRRIRPRGRCILRLSSARRGLDRENHGRRCRE